MFKKVFAVLMILVVALPLTPQLTQASGGNGVDDLRGRWDVDADWEIGDYPPAPEGLTWFVQDIEPSPSEENVFLANGCMRTADSGRLAPLSLVATYLPADNSYDLVLYSTVIMPEGEPYVIRFNGNALMHGKGVSDDETAGMLRTEFTQGGWQADHHDRRRPHCKGIETFTQELRGDVYAHLDLANFPENSRTNLEVYTRIVSSAMLVVKPNGEQVLAEPFTDIFSPEVDFVNEFRFLTDVDEMPTPGEPYQFILLDLLGNPIPGAENADIWSGCSQGAPTNLGFDYHFTDYVDLSWDAVADVPGEFEPGGDPQIGFYQVEIAPMDGGESNFGSGQIKSSSHLIPWNHFEPGQPGNPDGIDFGVSLSEFEDGLYHVDVKAFSTANPVNGGQGLECSVMDASQNLVMQKQGNDLSILVMGSISGRVYDAEGNPLGGIAVDIEEGGYGTCTNEDGSYSMQGMPLGTYNVVAGRDFCGPHPFMEQTAAGIELTDESPDVGGVDFHLEIGGSISGSVFDAQGNPLGGIGVDIEQGGYGTCTNEDGSYSMQGMTLGSYNVVAGRNFCGPHPYIEQMLVGVELTSETPEVGGVDFHLEMGGSISGNVSALAGGRSLASVQVGAHLFDDPGAGYWAGLSDLEGNYTILGLPPGDYLVFVAGEFGWQDLAYNQQADFANADRVAVALETGTPGINFQLTENGAVTTSVTVPAGGAIEIAALMTNCWEGSQDIYDGFLMALADYGPVQGFSITHNLYDTGCDSWGGKWAAAEAVNNPQIVGAIGPLWSSHTLGAAPLLQTAGVVMISPSATRPDLPDFAPTVFNRVVLEDPAYVDWNLLVSQLASVSAWEAEFQAAYGRPPNEFARYAYDATILLLTRIDEVGVLDGGGNLVIDRAALADAVRLTTAMMGVTGDISLDYATGNRLDTLGGSP